MNVDEYFCNERDLWKKGNIFDDDLIGKYLEDGRSDLVTKSCANMTSMNTRSPDVTVLGGDASVAGKGCEELGNLIKHLHNSYKVIQHLKEEIKRKTDVENRFRDAIAMQEDKFRKEIWTNHQIILNGYDMMMSECTKPSDVSLKISRETNLTIEDVDKVISRCILIEDICRKEKEKNDSGRFVTKFAGKEFCVDYSKSLKRIRQNQKNKCHSYIKSSYRKNSAFQKSPLIELNFHPYSPKTTSHSNSHKAESRLVDVSHASNVQPNVEAHFDWSYQKLSNPTSQCYIISLPYHQNYFNSGAPYASSQQEYPVSIAHVNDLMNSQESHFVNGSHSRFSQAIRMDKPPLESRFGNASPQSRIRQPQAFHEAGSVSDRQRSCPTLTDLRKPPPLQVYMHRLQPQKQASQTGNLSSPANVSQNSMSYNQTQKAFHPHSRRPLIPHPIAESGRRMSQNQRPPQTEQQSLEVIHDPTVPQKLMMKDRHLQAGNTLELQNDVVEIVENQIKKEEQEKEEEIQIIEQRKRHPRNLNSNERVVLCAQFECTNIGVRICKNCKSVIYCSDTCQIKHWNIKHKAECDQLKKLLEE